MSYYLIYLGQRKKIVSGSICPQQWYIVGIFLFYQILYSYISQIYLILVYIIFIIFDYFLFIFKQIVVC